MKIMRTSPPDNAGEDEEVDADGRYHLHISTINMVMRYKFLWLNMHIFVDHT